MVSTAFRSPAVLVKVVVDDGCPLEFNDPVVNESATEDLSNNGVEDTSVGEVVVAVVVPPKDDIDVLPINAVRSKELLLLLVLMLLFVVFASLLTMSPADITTVLT